MPTARESRGVLIRLTDAAVTAAVAALIDASGDAPEVQRATLLDAVPSIISYYSDGSSALAADFYDDERERAAARGSFVAEPVILDRTEKIRRGVAWAVEPYFNPVESMPDARMAEVVSLEVAKPYRDTITTNRRRDPHAVGWRRVSGGGCPFCDMLAAKGAIYRDTTARFASHPHCKCSAQPVFSSNDYGEEADVMQYVASKRQRTEDEKQRLREYLHEHHGGPAPSGRSGSTSGAGTVRPSGLAGMTRDRVEQQIRLTEGLKESDWRTSQLARLRERLAEF